MVLKQYPRQQTAQQEFILNSGWTKATLLSQVLPGVGGPRRISL